MRRRRRAGRGHRRGRRALRRRRARERRRGGPCGSPSMSAVIPFSSPWSTAASLLEQRAHRRLVARDAREHERRRAARAAAVDGRAHSEERAGESGVADAARAQQRRRREVGRRARVEPLAERREVAGFGGGARRRRHRRRVGRRLGRRLGRLAPAARLRDDRCRRPRAAIARASLGGPQPPRDPPAARRSLALLARDELPLHRSARASPESTAAREEFAVARPLVAAAVAAAARRRESGHRRPLEADAPPRRAPAHQPPA